jgi:hypothetical protein
MADEAITEMDWTGASLFEAFLREAGVGRRQPLSDADRAQYSAELEQMPVFTEMTVRAPASDVSGLGARFGRWHVGIATSLWRLLLSLAHTLERLATGAQLGWETFYSALFDVMRALPSLPVTRLSDEELDVYAAVTLARRSGIGSTAENVAALLDDTPTAASCQAILDALVGRSVLVERAGEYRAVF